MSEPPSDIYRGYRSKRPTRRELEEGKMKRVILIASVCFIAAAAASWGSEKPASRPRFYRPDVRENLSDILDDPRANVIAAVDTYCIVWFDFEQMDWQGWTKVDNTAQKDTFFHVDDFAGLGGGAHGMLVPLEGTKSMWCGARPDGDPYLCSWAAAPGYGNLWDQSIVSQIMPHTGTVTLSYKYSVDTELGNDYVSVIFAPAYQETEIARHYGRGSGVATHELFSASASFYLKFRFVSDAADSDEDGLRDYDGAFIIDSITVSDEEGLIDFEDFESAEVGATEAGIWRAKPQYDYGSYSGLLNNLVDKDPCNDDLATQITFIKGSPYPSISYPGLGLFDTPFCRGDGGINAPCQNEMVISPVIDLNRYSTSCDETQDGAIPPGELGDLSGYRLIYQVYLDNSVENLVFHTWKVRSIVDGCPGQWMSEPLVMYYGEGGLYYWLEHDISGYVTSDSIQVAVGVVDMCSLWYGVYGDCAAHTPAPWFDNVRVQRYETVGPQWAYQGADLFQDNFPSTDEMESFVRADMAADISPPSYPGIVPGDSVVVSCWATNAGRLDTLDTGEARVYLHCNVSFLGPDGKPDLFGPQLAGDHGSYVSDDGDWTVLLCEPARASNGAISPDRYCVDLNDSLFTRGYMIEYYFKAWDLDGVSTTLPAGAETMPANQFFGGSNLLEFTCLPTLRTVPGPLYVDDCDGRGSREGIAQIYYDWTFRAMVATLWDDFPDRYDVNSPSSALSNGIGAYVSADNSGSVFCAAYETVVFDSGDLAHCTVSEGTENSDKSDDARLLVDWMKNSEHKTGLLVMGDQIAYDLSTSMAAVATELVSAICGVTLENNSYFDLTGGLEGGGLVSPPVSGVPGGPYDGISYFLAGGCPVINRFDVLDATGHGQHALAYPDYNDTKCYAGIWTDQTSDTGQPLRTSWVGHGFQYMRNETDGITARKEFLEDAWLFFENGICEDVGRTDTEIPKVTSLSGNFPNPFNPSTRIRFGLAPKGHVSLRVYDVSGKLVRVLIDEVRDAGSYETVWDGRNGGGKAIASGIYFCRMEAKDFDRTLKMVLLR
jgi:hypothetical protein